MQHKENEAQNFILENQYKKNVLQAEFRPFPPFKKKPL